VRRKESNPELVGEVGENLYVPLFLLRAIGLRFLSDLGETRIEGHPWALPLLLAR